MWHIIEHHFYGPPGGEGYLNGDREVARGMLVEMKAPGRGALDCAAAWGLILTKMFRFLFISAELLSTLKLWLGTPLDARSFFLTVLAAQLPGSRLRADRSLADRLPASPPGLEKVSTAIEEIRMSAHKRATAPSLFRSFCETVFRGICPE